MDILYWINLNSEVTLRETTKIFFKKYLCKMQIYCPGGRSIYEHDVTESLQSRMSVSRSPNYGGSWLSRNSKFLQEADVAQLESVKKLLTRDDVKIRVEEPYVQFYADNESTLKSIIDEMSASSGARLDTVYVPRNQEHIDLLLENKILRRSRRNRFQYKVVCRDGRVDPRIKMNLLNYLDSLGDLVMVPKCSRDMLCSDYSGFWGVYYYTNDVSINTFVELIKPGIITNVHEIVLAK